jgi:hypothetical protein
MHGVVSTRTPDPSVLATKMDWMQSLGHAPTCRIASNPSGVAALPLPESDETTIKTTAITEVRFRLTPKYRGTQSHTQEQAP